MASKAIAVTLIGDRHTPFHHHFCSAGLESYAKRHNYNLHCLTEPVDPALGPYWQKLLALEALPEYDHVVVLDSDIVVNPSAPCIVKSMQDSPLVGAVTWAGSYHRDPEALEAMRYIWRNNGMKWVRQAGFQLFSDILCHAGYPPTDDWLNTGVLVLQQHHRDLMRTICKEAEGPHTSKDAVPAIHHLLGKWRGARVRPLDKRFNRIIHWHIRQFYPFISARPIPEQVVRDVMETIYQNSWFLHFIAHDQKIAPFLPKEAFLCPEPLPLSV